MRNKFDFDLQGQGYSAITPISADFANYWWKAVHLNMYTYIINYIEQYVTRLLSLCIVTKITISRTILLVTS